MSPSVVAQCYSVDYMVSFNSCRIGKKKRRHAKSRWNQVKSLFFFLRRSYLLFYGKSSILYWYVYQGVHSVLFWRQYWVRWNKIHPWNFVIQPMWFWLKKQVDKFYWQLHLHLWKGWGKDLCQILLLLFSYLRVSLLWYFIYCIQFYLEG